MIDRSEQDGIITIVSGLPRSGTSMMMKMLEAGGLPPLVDHVRTADEDNPKGYYEFERVKKLKDGDVEWVRQARGKVVKVIAALLQYLPADHDYRVLFMRRAMSEVLASQRQMLIRRGEDPDKFDDAELAGLFKRHLHKIDAWLEQQPNMKRFDVDYNTLIENPRPSLEQINRFLGGALDIERMIEVVDLSLHRQRV